MFDKQSNMNVSMDPGDITISHVHSGSKQSGVVHLSNFVTFQSDCHINTLKHFLEHRDNTHTQSIWTFPFKYKQPNFYLSSIMARQPRGARDTRLSLGKRAKMDQCTNNLHNCLLIIDQFYKRKNENMHTFCPSGACPGDSPRSPFCP